MLWQACNDRFEKGAWRGKDVQWVPSERAGGHQKIGGGG